MDQESLDKGYYQLSHLGYSSLVVGAIILYPHIEWVFFAILGDGSLLALGVVVLAVLVNLALLGDEDHPHY